MVWKIKVGWRYTGAPEFKPRSLNAVLEIMLRWHVRWYPQVQHRYLWQRARPHGHRTDVSQHHPGHTVAEETLALISNVVATELGVAVGFLLVLDEVLVDVDDLVDTVLVLTELVNVFEVVGVAVTTQLRAAQATKIDEVSLIMDRDGCSEGSKGIVERKMQ